MSYICSRYYRACELIFGATDYVLHRRLVGGLRPRGAAARRAALPGRVGVDQLVEIIKVLGTPTLDEIQSMNQNYSEYKFPQVKPHPWSKVFRPRTPPDAIDLVSKLLRYAPDTRLKPLEGCTLPLFDELRDANLKLPNGMPPPILFDFKPQELFEHPPSIKQKLIPIGTSSSSARAAADDLWCYYGARRRPARGAKGRDAGRRRPTHTPRAGVALLDRLRDAGSRGRRGHCVPAAVVYENHEAEYPAYGAGARSGAAAEWMRRRTARRRRCATHKACGSVREAGTRRRGGG